MKSILFSLFICCSFNLLFGQSVVENASQKSAVPIRYLGITDLALQKNAISIKHHVSISENETDKPLELQEGKLESYLQKQAILSQPSFLPKEQNSLLNEPTAFTGFNTDFNDGTPSDNSMAINNNNQIIAVVNSRIRFYNAITGAALQSTIFLQNFFSTPLNGSLVNNNLCDPKVIFDPVANRFILFAQTCDFNNLIPSQLLIAFSSSSDPTLGWHVYAFSGSPSQVLNGSCWFDYPKIAVSNHDLFITGNLFDNTKVYTQSVIYQLDKNIGYNGGTFTGTDAILHYNIANAPFTMVPVSNGQSGNYGSNMYLICNSSANNGFKLYEVTKAVNQNPTLLLINLSASLWSNPGDAVQKGTNVLLNSGDDRGQDGFYLDGVIHYVFHCSGSGGFMNINYSRLTKNGTNWTVQNQKIGIPNEELAFPSITSTGHHACDQSAIINFNYSSASAFPGMKAIFVDHNFIASNPVVIKTGTGAATLYAQPSGSGYDSNRWGDYTAVCRVYNNAQPTVFAFGCFGDNSNDWTNYIAKLETTAQPASPCITNATNEIKNITSIAVFPNPSNQQELKINIVTAENTPLNISLYNALGQLVSNYKIANLPLGNQQLTINTSLLSNGMYFLNVMSNTKTIHHEKIQVAN
jgi:hypothetical protein